MDLAQDGSRAGRLRAERITRADSCPRVVSRHLHAAAPPLHTPVSPEPVHALYHTRTTRHGRGIAGVARQYLPLTPISTPPRPLHRTILLRQSATARAPRRTRQS